MLYPFSVAQLPAPAPVEAKPASLSTHQQRREGSKLERLKDVIPGHSRLIDSFGKAFNACLDCFFKACPKANDKSGLCDVCDEVSETRAKEIGDDQYSV